MQEKFWVQLRYDEWTLQLNLGSSVNLGANMYLASLSTLYTLGGSYTEPTLFSHSTFKPNVPYALHVKLVGFEIPASKVLGVTTLGGRTRETE